MYCDKKMMMQVSGIYKPLITQFNSKPKTQTLVSFWLKLSKNVIDENTKRKNLYGLMNL